MASSRAPAATQASAPAPGLAPAPFLAPVAPLELQVSRAASALVGRPIEISAIEQELATAASGRLVGVTAEGEPGIGKTRLVLAASDLARARGFAAIAVTADEEMRGPFLLARSIFASQSAQAAAAGTEAEALLQRALGAITGRDDADLEALPPDMKLLRAFDMAALALRSLAAQRPVAVLIDDVQWADPDSLRMLRYLVRTDARSPIFLMLALRPSETAIVTDAVTLLADMERMGMVRRLTLQRFTQLETTEFLRQVLRGDVNPTGAATIHGQAEGVPFIVEELAHSYRDAGLLQEIDGVWSLARNAERLVPSAVRTLIQRRAARLPEATRTVLGEAGVLGRSFSLRDLQAVKARLDGEEPSAASLAEAMVPALTAGLVVQHPAGSAADYSFPHDQVREFAMAGLTAPHRRAIHAAVIDLLAGGGEPTAASLPLLAHHAVAAGDTDRAARFCIAGAAAALEARAPEEALRLVELALPGASAPQDRVSLLLARDAALEMLRRPADRLEGLAELAALVDALGDSHLELEAMVRRAAALRLSDQEDIAATLARRVQQLAAERGDRPAELAASLELAQALLRATLGESYAPTASEVDLDGAEQALERATVLAEELGDDRALAAATRELGTITVGRLRAWMAEFFRGGGGPELLARSAAGEPVEEIVRSLPVAPLFGEAMATYQRALELYERLNDRRGYMSTLIAMAFVSWGPDLHLGLSGRRIEELRRLATRMKSLTRESERALAEVQMLYGVQVFARAKCEPTLALAKGQEAYEQARMIGERTIEYLSAGGMALSHLEMGELAEGERWLGRAAAAAQAAPTPLRARQLEIWRGMACRAAGNARTMREHLERAVRMATEQGRTAARCEALARLAMEAAYLCAAGDEESQALAERSAAEAKALLGVLPGHPAWGAQADAAVSAVHLARGRADEALSAARDAFAALDAAQHEDFHLEILLLAAPAILVHGSADEQAGVRGYLQVVQATIAQRMLDEDVRVRWFRGPMGRRLSELAGPMERAPVAAAARDADGVSDTRAAPQLDEGDVQLLRLLTQGRTNREIAEELSMDERAVATRLATLYGGIGAASRSEATAFALRTV